MVDNTSVGDQCIMDTTMEVIKTFTSKAGMYKKINWKGWLSDGYESKRTVYNR